MHDGIDTASARMRRHAIRRLPIVDDDDSAVGIVTADDLLVLLDREMASRCGGIENDREPSESR